MRSVTFVAGLFFQPQFRRLFHRRVFTNDVKFLIFRPHYFVFLEWIHLFPKILELNESRGDLVVVEYSIIFKTCQAISCVMPLTRLTRINKPKFLEYCKKHKKCSKTEASNYENNSENCQGIESRMSGPKCPKSLSSRHTKKMLGVWISVREIFVSTRSRALIGNPLSRKHRVCCFVLLNRYWGIVMVPGFLHERAKGARTNDGESLTHHLTSPLFFLNPHS